MPSPDHITVRMFAALHTLRREQGLPTTVNFKVTPDGVSGRQIATDLGLAEELIDGLFLNGRVVDLDTVLKPGDRVAFLPPGTPALHPAFFGRR